MLTSLPSCPNHHMRFPQSRRMRAQIKERANAEGAGVRPTIDPNPYTEGVSAEGAPNTEAAESAPLHEPLVPTRPFPNPAGLGCCIMGCGLTEHAGWYKRVSGDGSEAYAGADHDLAAMNFSLGTEWTMVDESSCMDCS